MSLAVNSRPSLTIYAPLVSDAFVAHLYVIHIMNVKACEDVYLSLTHAKTTARILISSQNNTS